MIVTGSILAGATGIGMMVSVLASALTTRRMVQLVVKDTEDGFKARDKTIAQTRADLNGLKQQVETNLVLQNNNIERLLESNTAIAAEVRSLRLAVAPAAATTPPPAKRTTKRATESAAMESVDSAAAEQTEIMKPKLQKQTELMAV